MTASAGRRRRVLWPMPNWPSGSRRSGRIRGAATARPVPTPRWLATVCGWDAKRVERIMAANGWQGAYLRPHRYANPVQRSRHRNPASRLRIRHKPAIPDRQQIVGRQSSSRLARDQQLGARNHVDHRLGDLSHLRDVTGRRRRRARASDQLGRIRATARATRGPAHTADRRRRPPVAPSGLRPTLRWDRPLMRFEQTEIEGVWIVRLDPIRDDRGFFARAWARDEFERAGLDIRWEQANLAHNPAAGTLRGMHFQRDPHAEWKLVRCTRGRLQDVAVDLRIGSADQAPLGRHDPGRRGRRHAADPAWLCPWLSHARGGYGSLLPDLGSVRPRRRRRRPLRRPGLRDRMEQARCRHLGAGPLLASSRKGLTA